MQAEAGFVFSSQARDMSRPSNLRREIIKDPAQKILPGQDLAPGRMPGRVLFPLSNLANRPALLGGTPAQQEFQIMSKRSQESTQSGLINIFEPSGPAHSRGGVAIYPHGVSISYFSLLAVRQWS